MNTELVQAVESLSHEIAAPEDCAAWQMILAALRGLDGENARLRTNAESRLAAANALLREVDVWDGLGSTMPAGLFDRIQAHLQGAGDEH